MTARPSPRWTAALLAFAWCATGTVFAMGLANLLGWTRSVEILKGLRTSSQPPMNPMTAVGMILCGLSLALVIRRPPQHSPRQKTSMAIAAAIIALGAIKFISYRIPIPIDTLMFPAKSAADPIAPNTAAGFLTIGLALLLLDVRTKHGRRLAVPLALLTAAVALLALSGHIYGVIYFYRLGRYMPMALNTALALLLMGLAILAARPDLEPVSTFLSDTAGGVVARRLLPAAAVLPLGLGWLCMLGAGRGFFDTSFGATLFSLLTTVIFIALIWWIARFLRRVDTDRQHAERRAAEEHHLLRSLIDNLPDMVFVKDTQHRFLLNNLAHARALGAAAPEEMLDKSDLDYFNAELSSQFRAEERQVVEGGVAMIDKEQRIIDSKGATRVLSVAKVPFRDTQGNIVGIVGIAHDISLRKQVEEERDRFFTLSADMICVASFDGYFLRVNPAFETTLGYAADELTSHPWLYFVHPDDQAATTTEGKKLSLGAVTLYFENRYRCKDGSYRWLSWTAVPVVREQRIYAVARDTTERRAVEEQLRNTNLRLQEAVGSERSAQQSLRAAQSTMVQTEKLAGLGQMVAGVAHEINNPLSFVSNNVAVLQRDLRGVLHLLELYSQADVLLEQHDARLLAEIREAGRQMGLPYVLGNLQELLTRSRDGLKRIQQIVKDLRDFARLDESDLQECDLNAGIQSTVNIILGHAKKRGVQLTTEFGQVPKVICYPAKVNQVVMNLLTNAIDASSPEGRVTIRTRANDNDTISIEVSDAGTGIDPAIRERIFDPFFTTKPQGQGTGLGLSISYGIVRDHGGTIDVQSESGKGATFTVTFPVNGRLRLKK